MLLPGSQAVPALRPRRSKRGRVTLTIPSSTPAGSFHVLACADLANRVKEASERNNCRASREKVQVPAGAPGGGPQGTPAGPGGGGGGVPLAPPAAPTGLTAATVSSTQIDLAWNASAGATSYRVLRSDTPGGPYAEVASPSGPAYSDSGRTPDTAYHYVVRAANAAGESPDSAQASATTLPDPPPAPASLTATAVSASQINLTWPAASGATSYRVFRSTTSGSGFTEIATPATNSHSDTGRSSETTYFYLVQAVNTGGSSGNSPQASATTHFACSTTGDPGFGSASFLGSISGDTGNGVLMSTGEACTVGNAVWRRVTVTEDSDANAYLSARFDLTPVGPGNGDVDICIFRGNGTSQIGCSTNAGSSAESFPVRHDDNFGSEDTRSYYARIFLFSGASKRWELTVTGNVVVASENDP